jgi:outer membrane protein assembly factor BamE
MAARSGDWGEAGGDGEGRLAAGARRGNAHGYNSRSPFRFTVVDSRSFTPRPPRSLVCAALAVGLLAGGCATIDTYAPTLRSFGIYKLDINQGNFISQDMVEKLKVGQTRTQVRQILGTPLVVTVFRDDRWDYSYMFLRQGRVVEQRNFTVYFVDEKLARWEGDEAPPSAVELNREAAARTVGEMKWGSERSWWDSIKDTFGW